MITSQRSVPPSDKLWARRWRASLLTGGLLLLTATGCAVPQPRGEGTRQFVYEPSTGRGYYLYLPKDYVASDETTRAQRRWPLVVTFHGMKPYDIASYQELEWEYEADRYGYIVIAPVLNSFVFLFGQFPQRTITATFRSDEAAVLAIMDHVFQTTRADRNAVLSTGFSSGGYMAHYMLNRHPDRFTCLAPRQANFAASLLDATLTERSQYHPILILSTKNDIGPCKRETHEAIQWYEKFGYKNFAWITVNHLGHERTPDIAADFFARTCGAVPSRPPIALTQRQAIDGNPSGMALLAGQMQPLERAPGTPTIPGPATQRQATPARPVAAAAETPVPPANGQRPARGDNATGTPRRDQHPPAREPLGAPVAISISSAIGFEPLLIVFSAECPADWYRNADFFWTLNGAKIGSGVNGQKTITDPGDYTLELRVVTRDGSEHRASRQIRVLKSVEQSSARR